MSKRKKFGLAVLVVVLGVATSFGGYKFFTRETKNMPSEQKITDGLPIDEMIAKYDDTSKLVEDKSWEQGWKASKKYGEDANNPLMLRITAYANCAFAAQNVQNESEQQLCLKNGNDLVVTLPEFDREETKKLFDALSQGKTYTHDVPPEQTGE